MLILVSIWLATLAFPGQRLKISSDGLYNRDDMNYYVFDTVGFFTKIICVPLIACNACFFGCPNNDIRCKCYLFLVIVMEVDTSENLLIYGLH